jgi:PAS domain S-box-containing protein
MTFLRLPFRRSLRQRLPVVTSVLITGVLASFLLVAFREVESALIDAGAARAQGTADQLANLLADSAQQRVRATRRVARDSAIHRFLKNPNDTTAADAARVQLTALAARGQPPVELWDAQGGQLLVVSSPPANTESTAPPNLPTTTPPSERGVRAFQEWNGAIFWDTVDEVRAEPENGNSPLLGYLRSRRLVSTTSNSDTITRLVGSGAVVKLGNAVGHVWTDLTKRTSPPPIDRAQRGVAEYDSASGERRLGASALINETPWGVWVEFPRSVIIAPAWVFLTRMLFFGLGFILAAAVAARMLSERITRPLHDLTDAAEAIAGGNLDNRVEIRRPDEIGRLGAAFNDMAEQVRSVQRDLEDRVQQRTARLAQAEERTKAILRTANDAFIGMDADGRIVDWNAQAEATFGWSSSQAIGRLLADTIVPARHREAHTRGLARYLRTGEQHVLNQRLELTALRQNGDEFPVELTIWASWAGADQTFHAFIRDITERKRADQALQGAKTEAERANRAKSEFLSRMSHDLRTPLNAILGFAQLLESENLQPDQLESIRLILRGGRHLLQLINEALEITRIETGHLSLSPEPIDVGEVVQYAVELIAPLAAERQITIAVADLPEPGAAVMADRQRLTQVLLNLLSNAIKYNKPRGRVTVRFSTTANGLARINVIDTGVGMSPDQLKLLFRPFERLGAEATGIEGTGLGLALSGGLAAAMGGSIGVASEIDRGTTFWVELRLADKASTVVVDDVAPAQLAHAASVEGTVLYIEDHVANVRLMERVFQRRPRVVLRHASTGASGIRWAAESPPDVILLDIHLPDMNGEEVLRRILEHSHLRTIPVVVLSADATSEQSRRLLSAGATAYLTKPLEVARVLSTLDDLLSRSRNETEDAVAK